MWSFDRAARRQQRETQALARMSPDDYESAISVLTPLKIVFAVVVLGGGALLLLWVLR